MDRSRLSYNVMYLLRVMFTLKVSSLKIYIVFTLNNTQEMSLKAAFLNQGLPYPPYIRGLARGSDANISVPLGWVTQFM